MAGSDSSEAKGGGHFWLTKSFHDTDEVRRVYTENILKGGVFIETEQELPQRGEPVKLVIYYEPNGASISLDGVVAHTVTAAMAAQMDRVPGVGIRLNEVGPDEQIQFESFLASLPDVAGPEAVRQAEKLVARVERGTFFLALKVPPDAPQPIVEEAYNEFVEAHAPSKWRGRIESGLFSRVQDLYRKVAEYAQRNYGWEPPEPPEIEQKMPEPVQPPPKPEVKRRPGKVTLQPTPGEEFWGEALSDDDIQGVTSVAEQIGASLAEAMAAESAARPAARPKVRRPTLPPPPPIGHSRRGGRAPTIPPPVPKAREAGMTATQPFNTASSARKGEYQSALPEAFWMMFEKLDEVTYYGVLNLKSGATLQEIKQAYHKLSERVHPDLYPTISKEDREALGKVCSRISEAYSVLKNDRTRAMYDESLRRDGRKLRLDPDRLAEELTSEQKG